MRQLLSFLASRKTVLVTVLACGFLSGCQGGLSIENLEMLITPTLSSCWPCTMYKIVFDAIASVLKNSYTIISQVALLLLGIGLLFWLAFKVIGLVSTVKQPNLRDFITSMFGTFFKAIVVAVILSVPSYAMDVLNIIAEPVLKTFISMSRTVLLSDPTIAKHFTAPEAVTAMYTGAPLLSGEIGTMVQDIVYRIYVAFHSGLVLGFRMFISVDVVAYLMGSIIVLAFSYLMLLFPLMFIDSFVRMGCVFIFFPLLLTAWVFPSTKKYISEGWKTLFGATMQILVACIYIALMVSIVKAYSDAHSLSRQLSDPLILLGLKSAATEAIGFLALVFCMLKMTDKVPAISGYFGGDATKSEMVQAFSNARQMTMQLGKVAAGTVMVGTGLAVDAGRKLFDESSKEAKKMGMSGGQSIARWNYDRGAESQQYVNEYEIWNPSHSNDGEVSEEDRQRQEMGR